MHLSRSLLSAILLLLMAGAFPPPLEGQQGPPRLLLGVKGGVNSAALDTGRDRFVLNAGRSGRVGGVYVELGGGVFAVRHEVLLSQKGAILWRPSKGLSLGLHPGYSIEEHDYVEMPVLLLARIPTPTTAQPFLAAGAVVGCRVEQCSGGIRPGAEGYWSHDFSAAFGGGVTLGIGRFIWTTEGRYTHGLVDVSHTVERRHRVRSLTTGVGIRLD